MKSSKDSKDLPWWVELLYVQIGLPDSWLRSFLKSRKRTKILLRDNSHPIKYIVAVIFTIVYFYPIVKNAKIQNDCVVNSNSYIARTIIGNKSLTKAEIKSLSTHFCNGGNI